LRKQVESQLLPRYIEEIKKITSEIVEAPPKDINNLLEASKKCRVYQTRSKTFMLF